MNHLKAEKSPYLLQHAKNPVDWYPWCEEAFLKAKREGKPVFLSIGYSTCHWCHVMARESFEDPQVAEALNRDFIAVKVDREERPDIDAVYMTVCQGLTGSGGWPLTIVMTPAQKPFFAATYLPKTARYGSPGLLEVLERIARGWRERRMELIAAGEQLSALAQPGPTCQGEVSRELLQDAAEQMERSFDARNGGFGGAPKFPTPHNLVFLLRYSREEGDAAALHMAERTLEQMYRGGIFDHIGGGFSRYSTDAHWLAPHFEKMLYDNALLASAYTEAFRITRRPLYAQIARRTLDYLLRELRTPQGGFACGQDADSDGVEGKYYLLTTDELAPVLGEGAEAFYAWYGMTGAGNFEGANIPNLLGNPDYEKQGPQALTDTVYAYRLRRTRLHRDDKVLTGWNGLAIAALAKAGCVLEEPWYLRAAEEAMEFIDSALTGEDGRLFVRWRDGEAAHDGQLADYAYLALGCLELYSATLDAAHLTRAAALAERMLELFFDSADGGFYLYAADGEQLISRPKEAYDGAMPSGNSIAAQVLGRLARLSGESVWRDAWDKQLAYLAGVSREYPMGYCAALTAMLDALYPGQQLVCTAPEDAVKPQLAELMRTPEAWRLSIVFKTPENEEVLAAAAPFTRSYPIPKQGALYYLCQSGACTAPETDWGQVRRRIGKTNQPAEVL